MKKQINKLFWNKWISHKVILTIALFATMFMFAIIHLYVNDLLFDDVYLNIEKQERILILCIVFFLIILIDIYTYFKVKSKK